MNDSRYKEDMANEEKLKHHVSDRSNRQDCSEREGGQACGTPSHPAM